MPHTPAETTSSQNENDWRNLREFIRTLAIVSTEDDIKLVFEDLVTMKWLGELANRWKAIRLINSGLLLKDVISFTDEESAKYALRVKLNRDAFPILPH